MGTVFGGFVIGRGDADLDDGPEDVIIILQAVEVLNNLGNVPVAIAMLLALVYVLNLSYPPEWRYTFEVLQKLVMGLDGQIVH